MRNLALFTIALIILAYFLTDVWCDSVKGSFCFEHWRLFKEWLR